MKTTPIFGIRVPDRATKLKDLGAELEQTATDLESALVNASIPPVTPAPVMVAATAAARDQYWGIPGNETSRRTLQARGATTLRTDTGWEERYFATYDATTNPGGAAAAGWYPVSGRLPRVTLAKTSAQATTPNAQPLLWDSAAGTPGLWASGARDRLRPTLRGLWRFELAAVADLQNTQTFVGALGLNGAQVASSECWTAGNNYGAATVAVAVDVNITNPGTDYLTGLVYAPGVGDGKTIYPAKARMAVTYLGPA